MGCLIDSTHPVYNTNHNTINRGLAGLATAWLIKLVRLEISVLHVEANEEISVEYYVISKK